MHYPNCPYPQFRAPVRRKLSPTETLEAESEFAARLAESRELYRRFAQRKNVVKQRFYAIAMKLLERERQLFRAEEALLRSQSVPSRTAA